MYICPRCGRKYRRIIAGAFCGCGLSSHNFEMQNQKGIEINKIIKNNSIRKVVKDDKIRKVVPRKGIIKAQKK